MKRTIVYCAIGLILIANTISIHADVAIPKPSPQKGKVVMNVGLEVVPDAKAYDARLQIPKARLAELRAALAMEAGDESALRSIAGSSRRTVLAGLFLFMSLSVGGVWLARSGHSRGQRIVAALMLGTAVIAATAIITQANAGPPPGYIWRNLPQNLSAGNSTHGPLTIEIVAEDNGFKLILPLKAVDKAAKAPGEE